MMISQALNTSRKLKIFKSIALFTLTFISGLSYGENLTITLRVTESKEEIQFTPHLNFETSPAIKEAIDNGIRIQLIAKAQLYQPRTWWFDETLENKKITLEVFYFTLGKLYVVKDKDSGEQLGFNDYSGVWKEFEELMKFQFNKYNGVDPWIKFRIMLDKSALPTVMQLPVLFDSNWDINTAWFQQKVTTK